ncbi:MAG: hypothetical protein MJZ50_05230 [Treponema sp.]|nr:hypothetical protein [Treponema sp.]
MSNEIIQYDPKGTGVVEVISSLFCFLEGSKRMEYDAFIKQQEVELEKIKALRDIRKAEIEYFRISEEYSLRRDLLRIAKDCFESKIKLYTNMLNLGYSYYDRQVDYLEKRIDELNDKIVNADNNHQLILLREQIDKYEDSRDNLNTRFNELMIEIQHHIEILKLSDTRNETMYIDYDGDN